MKITPIEAGNFKLDGGAMFGVVPKSIWSRTYPVDSNNMITMAARCLLVEDGDRLTLIDTGMGNKQDSKFFGYYFMDGKFDLDSSLKTAGYHRDDITDVFLTHLHFDHCGGAINREGEGYVPAFAKARFHSNQDHWNWATKPNAREKASFLSENILPIHESGQLNFIPTPTTQDELIDTGLGFKTQFVDGHTDKMMIPHITIGERTFVYCADLLPTASHCPIAWVMGYDTRPLLTLDEKTRFLDNAATHNWHLILEHDAHDEVITVKHTDRGVRVDQKMRFSDFTF